MREGRTVEEDNTETLGGGISQGLVGHCKGELELEKDHTMVTGLSRRAPGATQGDQLGDQDPGGREWRSGPGVSRRNGGKRPDSG